MPPPRIWLQLGRPATLVLAADLVQPGRRKAEPLCPSASRAAMAACCSSAARTASPVCCRLLLEVFCADTEQDHLPPLPLDLLVEVGQAAALVLDGRLAAGDPLAIGGNLPLALADGFQAFGQPGIDVEQSGLQRLGRGRARLALGGQGLDLAVQLGQPLAEPPPIDQGHLGPQLLQAVGVFLVAAGLARLGPHAPQPAVHLLDDVRQPEQVLSRPAPGAAGPRSSSA